MNREKDRTSTLGDREELEEGKARSLLVPNWRKGYSLKLWKQERQIRAPAALDGSQWI